MTGYIYSIINTVNNKRYVGKTTNFEVRRKTHLNNLRKGKHHSQKLQRAWDKYGEDGFIFEVREVEIESKNELTQLEIKEIEKYNSYHDGYNATLGGEGANYERFTPEQYFSIKAANEKYKGIINTTARYFSVDKTVISDIVKNQTYPQFQELYSKLSQADKDKYCNDLIALIDVNVNDLPKIPVKEKEQTVFNALCMNKVYPNHQKAISEAYGHCDAWINSIIRKGTYKTIQDQVAAIPLETLKEIAESEAEKINLEEIFLKRACRAGGSVAANSLNKEDYFFAFAAQELGYAYRSVAEYFNISPATVKDWYSKRSRNKERKEYESLSDKEKSILYGRVKIAELSGKAKV